MMKRVVGICVAAFTLFGSVPAFAQLELPAPSPAAKVSQRVGLTDVAIEYSSPAVKGRKIWGELVPWDKQWRTGANAPTKITFSRDVTFGSANVPAGTYSIISLPSQSGWTIVLSKSMQPAMPDKAYDNKDEVARATATTKEIPHRERMTFIFSDTTDASTSLDLEWEKLRISVPIKVDTKTQVDANIKNAVDNAWRPHANAARYLAENGGNLDEAQKLVDASIAIKSTWFNNWIRADIMAKKNKWAEARKSAQAAWDLGQKDENFFFRNQVQTALTEWKNKK